jgi:hypothetical protein
MEISDKVISKQGKKVVNWGPGLAIMITKEARKIGRDSDTFVRLLVLDYGKQKRIVIEKIGEV